MALILTIDTSSDRSILALTDHQHTIQAEENSIQKNHASFIQPAIKKIFLLSGHQLKEVDAIAVVAGPGSYTGLRVGLATAKGLCYALGKPLIFLSSLELLAFAAIREYSENKMNPPVLYCPMIDARRMEVFTALYDEKMNVIEKPSAMILTASSFEKQVQDSSIVFSGNGAAKFKSIFTNENAIFSNNTYNSLTIAEMANRLYNKNQFVNTAYSEPVYLKEFFNNTKIF